MSVNPIWCVLKSLATVEHTQLEHTDGWFPLKGTSLQYSKLGCTHLRKAERNKSHFFFSVCGVERFSNSLKKEEVFLLRLGLCVNLGIEQKQQDHRGQAVAYSKGNTLNMLLG